MNKNFDLFLSEFKSRGLLKDSINLEELKNNFLISENSFYIGIDPTGPSLHLGHYLTFNIVKLLTTFSKLKPIFVLGGFTALIGDPSGKNSERQAISSNFVLNNIEKIIKQIKFLCKTLSIDNFEIFNNNDIYSKLSIVDFYQKFGKFFNVNTMLAKEMVKSRLETGISYTEFSYQIFQSIDFLYLSQNKKCILQIGGSDQWGNIVSGINLIEKVSNDKLSGITTNLVVDSQGKKIGKTTNGNILWVESQNKNEEEIFKYQIFHFFWNLDDETAHNYLLKLTLLPIDSIKNIVETNKQNPSAKLLHKNLLEYLFEFVYGWTKKDFQNLLSLSKNIFEEKFDILTDDEIMIFSKSIINFEIQNIQISLRDFIIEKSQKDELNISGRKFDEIFSQGGIKIFGNKLENKNEIIQNLNNRSGLILISLGKKQKIFLKIK